MKKIMTTLMLLILSSNLYANIRYINYSNFPNLSNHETQILYVLNHENYMDDWVPKWEYDIDKQELLERMIVIHDELNSEFQKNPNNIDLCLFLGEISHFLYNLNESDYFDKANNYYDKAVEIEPRDFRSKWFKGYHLIQSNKPIMGMELLLYAETALEAKNMPSHFWIEYCIGSFQSQMYFHALKGYNNFLITRKENEGAQLSSIIDSLKEKIITPNINQDYKDIWKILFHSEDKNDASFMSYLYGVRLKIPNEWILDYSDSKNGQATIFMKPEEYSGNNGQKINATILAIMKTVSSDISLESYIQKFLKDKYVIKESVMDLDYDKYLAYSIKDNSLYPEQGGGNMFLLAIERDSPKNPGEIIELPSKIGSNQEGLNYYTMKPILKRFNGRIIYTFFLDACDSIHSEAFLDFKKLIEQNMVIE